MAKLGRPIGSKNKPKVHGPPDEAPLASPKSRRGPPPINAGKQFLREVGRLGGLPGDEERNRRVKPVSGPRSQFPEERAAGYGLPGVMRPPGSTNPGTLQRMRRSSQAEVIARVVASGLTPLEYLLDVLRDTSQPKIRRDWAAERSAPYCHSRIAAVVHTGRGGGPIQTLDLSKITDEQLAVLEDVFGTLVRSRSHLDGVAEGEDTT